MRLLSLLVVLITVACGAELGDAPDVGESGGKGDGAGDGSGGGGGGGSGSGSGSGSMPYTATAFFNQIGKQYCDESFRCQATYPNGPAAFTQDFGTNVSECYADANQFYAPAAIEQSITAGRIVFNATAAKSCADGITYQQTCSTFWQNDPVLPASCGQAIVGTVANGGACTTDYDCSSLTAFCNATSKTCQP
jgi:hypothetical protein